MRHYFSNEQKLQHLYYASIIFETYIKAQFFALLCFYAEHYVPKARVEDDQRFMTLSHK